ncbi:MAG: hypothetical protein ACJ748_06475 [Flavisolibacter sp.]
MIFLFTGPHLFGQSDSSINYISGKNNTYTNKFAGDTADQRDFLDVIVKLFKPRHFKRSKLEPGNVSFIIIPGAYYSIPTGMAVTLNASIVYYSSDYPYQNLSSIFSSASATARNQRTFTLYSNIYTKKNNFYFQGVGWIYDYSESTYGLGGNTTDDRENRLKYKYLRFYESILKQIYQDVYIGAGYKLDYHYDIEEQGNKDGTISDFKKYYNKDRTVSSGVSIDFMFDDRRNQINPRRGTFLNVVYSPKLSSLGSDNNWQFLKVDLRKYIKLSPNSNNLLAFWSLNQFTFGNAPYLDLPAVGWDDMQRSGRGYAQARYRGKDMLYLETEYRFRITHNGVLGGAVFANATTFSTPWEDKFQSVLPAAGAGIRIKLNKYTRTNLCIDYGVGIHGASGVFVNIGEIF